MKKFYLILILFVFFCFTFSTAQCIKQAEIISHIADRATVCMNERLIAKKFTNVTYAWTINGNPSYQSWNEIQLSSHYGGRVSTGMYVLKMTDSTNCVSYDSIYLTSTLSSVIRRDIKACFPGTQVFTDVETLEKDVTFRWKSYSSQFSDNTSSPYMSFEENDYGNTQWVELYTTAGGCTVYDSVGINLKSDCPTVHQVSGMVYNDLNRNGKREIGETGVKEFVVSVGDFVALTDSNGFYKTFSKDGLLPIKINPPAYYTSSIPASKELLVKISGAAVNGADFALYRENFHDLSTTISTSRARPGMIHTITNSVYNNGDFLENYTSSAITHPSFAFQTATDGGFFDAACYCVRWPEASVSPAKAKTMKASFMVPTTEIIVINFKELSNIALTNVQEYNLNNNADSLIARIVNSFDPNDKLVTATPGNNSYITPKSVLDYTIRFQNTGTDTAYMVVLKDSLDKNLDLSTFKVIGASHRYRVSLDSRLLTISFDPIALPDSGANQMESNGFFRFKIKPNPNTPESVTIFNRAGIYFDYNPPVYTNTTESKIQSSIVNGANISMDETLFHVYPNPGNGVLQVDGMFETLTLTHTNGKTLITTNDNTISLSGIAPGVYFLKIQHKQGTAVKKIVVK